MLLCLSASLATASEPVDRTIRVARVWRRSCPRQFSIPAASKAALKGLRNDVVAKGYLDWHETWHGKVMHHYTITPAQPYELLNCQR
jgi:hypothetical protein